MTHLDGVGGVQVHRLEPHGHATALGVSEAVGADLVRWVLGSAKGRRVDGAIVQLQGHVTSFVVLDPIASTRVGMIGLGVDVEGVGGGDDQTLIVLHGAAEDGQNSVVRAGSITNQDKVLLRLQVQVQQFQGDDLTRVGLDHVQALQASGVLSGVVGAGQDLRSLGGHEVAPAGLGLGPPTGTEASLLHPTIRSELDDHKVGGRDEGLLDVLLVGSRQGGNVGGSFNRSTTAQDLQRVKVALGVKVGEL